MSRIEPLSSADAISLIDELKAHGHVSAETLAAFAEWALNESIRADAAELQLELAINPASFGALSAAIENPSPPTPALVALFRSAQ